MGSISYSDREIQKYPLAREFIEGTYIWGKSELVMSSLEYLLHKYGSIPGTRDELKAFILWVNNQNINIIGNSSISNNSYSNMPNKKKKVSQKQNFTSKSKPTVENEFLPIIKEQIPVSREDNIPNEIPKEETTLNIEETNHKNVNADLNYQNNETTEFGNPFAGLGIDFGDFI